MVKYDGSIRNQIEQLIQLTYGEDGLDACHVEFQDLPMVKPSDRIFEKKFKLDPNDERQKYVSFTILVDAEYCNLLYFRWKMFGFWC